MTAVGAVGLLVLAAALLGTRPAGSARRRLRGWRRPHVDGAPTAAAGPVRHGTGSTGRGPGRGADPTAELCAAVAAVAAEVRAGRAPAEAWRAVLGVPVEPDGIPDADAVVAAVSTGAVGPVTRVVAGLAGRVRPGLAAGRRPTGRPGGTAAVVLRGRVAGVLAATRLATVLGAPLAGVLDGCVRSLSADADAETAVRAALAGPRQTTTLLTWLPVLGVGLGTLLGADAVGVLLGGGLGTTSGVCGALLTAAGRVWVARMARRARGDGAGRADG